MRALGAKADSHLPPGLSRASGPPPASCPASKAFLLQAALTPQPPRLSLPHSVLPGGSRMSPTMHPRGLDHLGGLTPAGCSSQSLRFESC